MTMVDLQGRLEYTSERDQYFNYCWWPYEPVAPVERKFRPVNLLFHSFVVGGMPAGAFDLVEAIRSSIGVFRTVWGTKWLGDRLVWEFYFYDYQRREREVSISRLLEVIHPFAPSDVPVNESLPYFMFSLDIDCPLLSGSRNLESVHMYVGNPGSTVSSGIAYTLTRERTTLENFYFFFNASKHRKEAAEKIYCSAYVDASKIELDRILIPELRECHTICIANKQNNDTVYFSGVTVDQLLVFLRLLDYPSDLIEFVVQHRNSLDHLLYDVGFDYIARGTDLIVLKSGYYGVF